ncbi:MAG: molybdopterin-synthase adenylyltransferase MoeB [Kiritimatiellae bacterium]|nr:molybdopterin-synthase adenylyltransferase MoeB [Kiritimatiellia bacterium]MDW8457900.1 molybdopterin-synthase adenylyltransferase MoeB [Verrucomicrobiota bacterium]
MVTPLHQVERARYLRQMRLPEIGEEGQIALKRASVLVVGLGGLGSPAAYYLAAAGVGRIGLMDPDTVDASNLHRQILYGERDLGRLKVTAARDRLADLNPHIELVEHPERFSERNGMELARAYDIVVDGADNFETRYLVNDACALAGKPNVHAAIQRFEGRVAVFWAAHGACYRCLHPEPPPAGAIPSCAEAGVLGVLPGLLGCLQAMEAIKLILRRGDPLVNRMLMVDALGMRIRELRLKKDPACPLCGNSPTIRSLQPVMQPVCFPAVKIREIEPRELKRWLDEGRPVNILDVREDSERAIARLPATHEIPMRECLNRITELDPSRPTVVFCKSGGRSAMVIRQLMSTGFPGELFNLRGGCLAWSETVDPSVPKY